MGNEDIISDLCVLKTKILEVFEDLMVCDEFSVSQENRLYEAFNFLEESLCILSDVSIQISSELVVVSEDKETSDKATKIETVQDETDKVNEPVFRKRKYSEEDEKVQKEDDIPPAKRGKKSPRKSSGQYTNHLVPQDQTKTQENVPNIDKIEVEREKTSVKSLNDKVISSDNPAVKERDTDQTVVIDVNHPEEKTPQKENVVLKVEIPLKRTPRPKCRGRPKKDLLQNEIVFKVNDQVECKDCRRTLCSQTELVDHVCHPETDSEATYQCDKCDIVFETKAVILNHLSNHKDKATASCRTCSKTFKFSCLLKSHSHGEEGNFKCKKCDKIFTYKKQYQLHISTHKMQKNDKGDDIKASSLTVPFTCPVCNIIIKSACNIKRHLDIHKEKQNSCNVCGKRFTRSDHLRDHMKIHTGARPSICELCGKGCLNRSDLNRHLRIHTGSKPYVCPVCERGFTQKCTLDKHVKLHEKKPSVPKLNKANKTNKLSPGPAQYTYKQMMKDLGKTPKKPMVEKEPSSSEERNVHEERGSQQDKSSSKITTQIMGNKIAKPFKSKSPMQASRPQLFTLLTDTKTLVPSVTSPGKVQLGPSISSATPSSGGNTQHMQMVQAEDGSTHIILPNSMEVGQEILVFVDKSAESQMHGNVEEVTVKSE